MGKVLSQIRGQRIAAFVALAMALGGCAADREPHGRTGSVVDEVARRAIGEGKVVGLVVVVARDAEVVFERGYGLADVQTDEPMASEAVLDYFSIGKHATAAILLRLAERGELNLDAPARLYLPEADFEGYDVTTRQLLSHTSGLWEAERDENELPASYRVPPPDGAILAWANQGERLAAPGETWMYSGGGFLFAGEIAERLTGRTFEQLIDEELAGPLGLQNFMGCADVNRDRASAYFIEAGETHRIAEVDPEWFGGAGTVCGTAGDLMRWWLALRSGRVVNASSLDQIFSPTRLRRNGIEADFGYGLGVRLGGYAGHRKIGHTGSGSGGTSVLAEYPDAGLAILVITNTAGDGARSAYELEAEIASTLLGADTGSVADARISDDLLRAAPGVYRSPLGRLCVSARGAELWRSLGNTAPERLRHVGAGRFVAADDAHGAGVEYFLGIGSGSAQWFAYDRHGFPYDLAVRVDDDCS
jgi:CubicO group peptidase (beta-lactamase class C family)